MNTVHIIDLNFQQVPESIGAFLMEGSDGYILIESGPHSTLPVLREQLADVGVNIRDISHILLTHIHLDHAGAAWAIVQESGAEVYVHPRGEKHLLDPSKLLASAKRIYLDQMDRLWGDLQPIPGNKLKTAAHGEKIQAGGLSFTAWHTPGHASHHITWQQEGNLFTGDVAGARIGEGLIVPPCPPPDIDVAAWKNSIKLIQELNPDALYLTHFGRFTDVSYHLEKLENRLDEWVAWMKPHVIEGSMPEVVLTGFKKLVEESYDQKGMSQQLKEKYAKANPLDMNVSGLARYWQQQLKP